MNGVAGCNGNLELNSGFVIKRKENRGPSQVAEVGGNGSKSGRASFLRKLLVSDETLHNKVCNLEFAQCTPRAPHHG